MAFVIAVLVVGTVEAVADEIVLEVALLFVKLRWMSSYVGSINGVSPSLLSIV